MGILSSLTREQKEAVGLLQIGTFLEYFDLMLYVHMAVLLNELFFPKTDPHTAALLTAFAFCSTWVFRPFGALIFGYIGDHIGRKTTVIITTMMMSISCIIMANLPTYAQIGISAAWIVTGCRIFQGLSSMGEIMGAMVYVMEITKFPVQYSAVAFIGVASSLGAVAALGISVLVTSYEGNWRIAFWIGASIAVMGSIARTRLRETPDFINAKKRIKKDSIDQKKASIKTPKKNILSGFLIQCGWPLSFYIAYMHFNPILKSDYGYSPEDIILHNFLLSIVLLLINIFWATLSYKIHPLKIIKLKAKVFCLIILSFPFFLSHISHQYQIFILQSFLLIVSLGANPADAVIIKSIPILKRVTITSFVYALARSVMYVITSFGLIYLSDLFGNYGILIIVLPVAIGFIFGVHHLEKLEKASGNFPEYRVSEKLSAIR